jgi:tetratricopeptide (TPR) repeat protein
MTPNPSAVRAAESLRSKADRVRASAQGKADSGERLRQAEAMQDIAGHVGEGVEALRAALGPVGTASARFTVADRERAGQEVYGLAQRRAEKGTQRQLDASAQAGWERGGNDMPIHRATLREAAQLYELALAIHYDSYWDYSRGLLHESLGEFEKAIDILDNLDGHYRKYGPQQAERCRRKLAGSYDSQAEFDAALGNQLDASKRQGIASGLLGKVFGAISAASKQASTQPYPTPPPDADTAPLDSDTLDRAEGAARDFAEHLAGGDFAAARELLASNLRSMSADALREEYLQMMGAGEFDEADADADEGDGGEVTVMVMSSSADMPDLDVRDLGWVYVAISNALCSEAVTVVVTEEDGEARIRELEWGRP